MRNPGEVSQCLQRNILLYHTPDISTQPNLLLVCYNLISSTSWVIICFSGAEAHTHTCKRQNAKFEKVIVIFATWIWYHLLTWLLVKSVSNLLNWNFMPWVTFPFIVKLSDAAPLRKPSYQSEIWGITLSCSKSSCFWKAAAQFTLVEDLAHKILQGQILTGQWAKMSS